METLTAVKSWLTEHGIAHERIELSKGFNWFKFNATVEEAESLLRTKYSVYKNVETGKDHLACEDYSVPPNLREHIDFITPTVHFDAIVKTRKKVRSLENREMKVRPFPIAHPGPSPIVRPGTDAVPQPQVAFTLANCFTYVTPECLRALYGFTNGTLSA